MSLEINLGRIQQNYQRLCSKLHEAQAAAVVKANAYGLGCVEVSTALEAAGCRSFFVATLDEGIELRQALPNVDVYVLEGSDHRVCEELAAHDLIPVLNSLGQVDAWNRCGMGAQRKLPAALHLDTGMNRAGLGVEDLEKIADRWPEFENLDVGLLMSHLSCADDVNNSQNSLQLKRFVAHLEKFPPLPASLANSAGIFLGTNYHLDMVRPGVALYGGNPCIGKENLMRQVVRLTAPILQVRNVKKGDFVGYGATHEFHRPTILATVPIGYADGIIRSAGNQNGSLAYVGAHSVPIVGRISMDFVTLDITDVPGAENLTGEPVEFIGERLPIDEVAKTYGTIAHELLAGLGPRLLRTYVA